MNVLQKTNDIEWGIIPREQVPRSQKSVTQRQGQWRSLARHFALLPPDQAMWVDLDRPSGGASVRRSFSMAARAAGVKITATQVDGKLYISKAGKTAPYKYVNIEKFCEICKCRFTTNRPWQITCGARRCKLERMKQRSEVAYEKYRFIPVEKECPWCKSKFMTRKEHQMFCCENCRKQKNYSDWRERSKEKA